MGKELGNKQVADRMGNLYQSAKEGSLLLVVPKDKDGNDVHVLARAIPQGRNFPMKVNLMPLAIIPTGDFVKDLVGWKDSFIKQRLKDV